MRTLIVNGTIVSAEETYKAELLLENGKVSAIGEKLNRTGAEVIDAEGCYVMPGAVDVHTHMDLPVGNFRAVDNFYTGTVAAACGGTTTIVDHMGYSPMGRPIQEPVDEYHRLADGNAVVDYGFHGLLDHVDNAAIEDMAKLVAEGIPSFKVYLTYPDRVNDAEALRVLRRCKELGAIMPVHCENHDILTYLREYYPAHGKIEPIYHALSRPDECEAEAVGRMIQIAALAEDAPLYVVHTSAAKSLDLIRHARSTGQKNIFVETCTQYLALNEDKYLEPNHGGLKYIMSPPLRKQSDCDAMWKACADGTVQVIATDHCPFNFNKEKQAGLEDFVKCPNGGPGVEERVRVVFSEGVIKGRISLNKFVELLCTNPAKIYGFCPQKGVLLPGSDGDVIIINPNKSEVLTERNMRGACDYTAYEGLKVQGVIEQVLLRGKVIVKHNDFLGQKGDGQYIKRHPVMR